MIGATLESTRYEAISALRSLRRGWRLSLIVILILGSGIFLSAASIAAFRRVVLEPLPLPRSWELHRIQLSTHSGSFGLTEAQIESVSQASAFEGVGGYLPAMMTLQADRPIRVHVARATPRTLETLGLSPIMGTSLDGHGASAAVIDESLWKASFGADPSIVGRRLVLDGRPYELVGIVPSLPLIEDRPFQVWLQASQSPERRSYTFFTTVARVGSAIPPDDAERILQELLAPSPPVRLSLTPLNRIVVGNVRELSLFILLGAFSILGASCAVVVLLLLLYVTTGTQVHGFAVRKALGASRVQLAARVGGLVGGLVAPSCAVASGGLFALAGVASRYGEHGQRWALDGTVMLAVAGTGAVVVLACFVPAYTYVVTRTFESEVTRSWRGVLANGRLTRGVVLGSVTACTVLFTICSARAFSSLTDLSARPLGFEAAGRAVVLVSSPSGVPLATERAFWTEVLAGLARDRRVHGVGLTSSVPLHGGSSMLFIPTGNGHEVALQIITASEGLFGALGIDLIHGRAFSDRDDSSNPPVAILNKRAAELLHGSAAAAIGTTIDVPRRATVIGVSTNHVSRVVQQETLPVLWLPYLQHSVTGNALVVEHGETSLSELEAAVRSHVTPLDPTRPLEVLSLDALVDAPLRRPRTVVRLFSVLSTALVFFCMIVIGGNLLFVLRLQRRDNAIRMALGAVPARIALRQIRAAAGPLLVGAVSGVAASSQLVGALGALLPGLHGYDLLTSGLVSLTFLLLSLFILVLATAAHARRVDICSELAD